MSEHTIRSRDGKTVTIKNYHRSRAIKLFCSECLGWENNPVETCSSPLCPIYPFRGRSLLSQRGNDESPE